MPDTARNHEITTAQPLLNAQGHIAERGWSRKPLQSYTRESVTAPKIRLKEWDYYLILGQGVGVALTISDDGYIGLQSVALLDFELKTYIDKPAVALFPMGKLHLPNVSTEDVTQFENSRMRARFEVTPGRRHLSCLFRRFHGHEDFTCDFTLDEPEMDSLTIATPWQENPRAFYYNRKINCMAVSGYAQLGAKRWEFDPATDFATLDWGRGVWTYDNNWFWSSGNGVVNGKPFGFNLGYGFGNTAAATENLVIYNGVGHKLDDVQFNIPEGYLAPWTFTSSDGRFEADFLPVLDHATKVNIGVICTDGHQVFGRMTGRAILDDGTALEIKDLLCFAEDVRMKY